jgi:hypothetical protein
MNRLVNAAISTANATYQYGQQVWSASIITATLRATHTEEQINQISQLRALIVSLQAPDNKRLPETPEQLSQLIETQLQDAERALGPADIYLASAYSYLGDIFLKRQDRPTAEKYNCRLLDMTEKSYGRRSKRTLFVLQNLYISYLKSNDIDKSTEISYRVADLQAHFLPEDVLEPVLGFYVLKEIAEPRGYDRAEAVQRKNLEIFQKVYGSAHQLTTSTVYQLILACATQCHDKGTDEMRDAIQVLRYILDVIHLSQKHTGIERYSCITLVRMCLFAGLESDAIQAHKHYFASEEKGPPSCMKCGSENHMCGGGPECDMCKTSFTMDMKRYVCKTCEDVDVCGTCYSKDEEERATLVPFSNTCQDHAFFELPEPKKPKETIEDWIQSLQERISVEIHRIVEDRNVHHTVDSKEPEHIYHGISRVEFIRDAIESTLTNSSNDQSTNLAKVERDSIIFPGYLIDTISNTYSLDVSNPQAYAKTLWHLNRSLTSPATYFHHRLPNNPLTPLLTPHITTPLSSWAFNSSSGLPQPFTIHAHPQLAYTSALLSKFNTPLTALSLLTQNPRIQETTAFRSIPLYQNYFGSSSWKQTFYGPGFFRMQYDVECKVSKAIAGVGGRLLKLLEYLADGIGREDFLGACLFDYEVLVGEIGGLRGPGKVGEYEGDVRKIVGEMLEKVALLKGSIDEKGAEPTDQSETGTGEESEGFLPPQHYADLQNVLTDCEFEAEVAMRVRVVLQLAATLRNLIPPTQTRNRLSPTDLDSYIYTLRTAEKYWKRLSEKSHTRQAILEHIVNLYTHLHLALDLPIPQVLDLGIDINSISALSASEQEHRVDKSLFELEKLGFVYGKDVSKEDVSGVLDDGTTETDDDSDSYVVLPSPKQSQSPSQGNRTFFTTTLGFVGVTAPGMGSVRPGDSLLYLVNAKLPVLVRKVEGSDLCEMLGFAVVREFADEKCEGSDELRILGKRDFQIRTELQN